MFPCPPGFRRYEIGGPCYPIPPDEQSVLERIVAAPGNFFDALFGITRRSSVERPVIAGNSTDVPGDLFSGIGSAAGRLVGGIVNPLMPTLIVLIIVAVAAFILIPRVAR